MNTALSRGAAVPEPARPRPFVLYPEARPDSRSAAARPATVVEAFARVAAAHPEAGAIACDGDGVTYAQMDAHANRLARRLIAAGVRPGDRVGFSLQRSGELVTVMLAILKAGASYLPLDPSYPDDRLAFMRRDAGVTAVVVARAADARLSDGEAVRVVALEDERDAIAALPASAPAAPVFAESEAYVVYTSGSTGTPKGISIRHGALVAMATDAGYADFGPGDRVAQMANTSFDAAAYEIWGALLNGAAVVMLGRAVSLDPQRLASALRAQRVTAAFLTTALFNAVSRVEPDAFATLALLGFGGEAVDPAAVRRVLAAGAPERLLHFYGPSENTTFATWHEVDAVDEGAETVPIGRAVGDTVAYVLDEAMKPVADGEAGELYLGGARLARGYVARPRLTAERFVADPFSGVPGARLYRTGDQVRRDARGELEFVGRLDGQVKLRGFRVETREVAAVLERHPEVEGAIVFVRDDAGERRLVAYVVPSRIACADLGPRLRAGLKDRLPYYMVPSAVVTVPAFPLTPNGKVDLRALPTPGRAEERPYVAPRTETEGAVAALWREVLRVERVSADDDFFELGGHSLLATQLAVRVREAFRVELPLERVFESPTVAAMSVLVDDAREAAMLAMLDELDGLSDEEVAALLAAESAALPEPAGA